MKKEKEKIIEILEKVDELHSDGFALKEYLDKLAEQILELFAQEKQKWIEAEIERLEGMKKEETDYRNDDYTRGMEAGRNYLIDDQISHLKELLVTLKR